MVSDAYGGLKEAIRRVMGSSWQRCRVHWMRNALSHVPKAHQSMVSVALRQAFIQPNRASTSQTLRHVADQLRDKWPRLGASIDESETDVLAHMDVPAQHRAKIHWTNPIERLNKEVKRRADVVDIFANEGPIIRLIGGRGCWRPTVNGKHNTAMCKPRRWLNLHRQRSTPCQARLSPWPHDQWPSQFTPEFPPR